MVRKRKLLERALSNPQNVRFQEFVTLLEAFGFQLARTRGSHHIFVHPLVSEIISIQPKEGGRAKPYQLRQFFGLIEQYNLQMDDAP